MNIKLGKYFEIEAYRPAHYIFIDDYSLRIQLFGLYFSIRYYPPFRYLSMFAGINESKMFTVHTMLLEPRQDYSISLHSKENPPSILTDASRRIRVEEPSYIEDRKERNLLV